MAVGQTPYLGELAVWTLAVVPHSAVVTAVEAVGSAEVQKAAEFVEASSSAAAAAIVANLQQQPLPAGFVEVVSFDAVPLAVAAVVLQMPYFAGLEPVTCSVYDAAAVVKLVLQIGHVMAAGLLADSVVAPADRQLAACSVEVTVALFVALVVVVAAGLDGLVTLQTRVVEVAALVLAAAPAVRSVLVKQKGNYWVQLHSDQMQDLS